MQVLSNSAGPASAFVSGLCEAIPALGRSDFLSRLLAGLRHMGHPEYVSVFAFPESGKPIFLGTDSSNSSLLASRAASHYLSHHYQDDPNRVVQRDGAGPADCIVPTYVHRDQIPTLSYRLMCYDQSQIVDRLSLLTWTGEHQPVTISFYRSIHSGAFRERDIAAIVDVAPVIRAMVLRHLGLAQPTHTPDLETAAIKLKHQFPVLSDRQATVAAGVVAGMTGEEIAGRIGIALTSVITHRKSAYERLGVTGVRELVALFYRLPQ